ncbi:ATP-dependent DNA helicase PIF1-like protein [Tanacetum coccineum]
MIYKEVTDSIDNQKDRFYFVYGPGGTGKIFLYKTIIARLRSEKKIVLAVASSGIASLLLPSGWTVHSRFVIPLELMENSTCVQQIGVRCGRWNFASKKEEDGDEETWIEIPEEFIINSANSSIEQIVKETFPDFATRKSKEVYLKERAILMPRNDDADAINAYMFEKLQGPTITYNSADEVCKASTNTLD